MSSVESFAITPEVSVIYSKKEPVAAIMLLGLGQHEKSMRIINDSIDENVALIEALPYHKLPLDSLEPLCIAALSKLIREINGGAPIHGIADSQAAPMLVKLAAESPELFRSLTLLEPLGFNKDALGSNDSERYRSLMARSRKFWKHPNQSLRLSGNRDTIFEIAKRSLPALSRIKSDYTFGANQDVVAITKKLSESLPVRIFASKSDSLFPYDEIEAAVNGSAITLIETDVESHLNRTTPKGLGELQKAIASLPGSAH